MKSKFKFVITLPKEFQGKGQMRGYQFKQIHREQDFCIYEVSRKKTKFYELIKPRIAGKILDVSVRPYLECKEIGKEHYPKANQFGKNAWTLSTREKAFKKLNEKLGSKIIKLQIDKSDEKELQTGTE